MANQRELPDLGQLGVTGLPRYSGYVYDEWLPELQGPRGRRVLREMADNDPIIGAILFSLEMLIRQVAWNIQPGSADAQSIDSAKFIDQCINDMAVTWEDTLSEVLSFLTYGWSLHEIVYKERKGPPISKYSDGKIGWHSWSMRGQETLNRWEFDEHGGVLGMWQLGPPDFRFHFIPLEKALLFRTTTRRSNPEGRSILRNAYRPWFFSKHLQTIEAIGAERDLAGLPMALVPSNILAADASPEDAATRDRIRDIVINLRRDEQEAILWPSDRDEDSKQPLFELKLLTTGGQRQFDTDTIISRYEQRMTMTVMADFIILGHERVGSNALAQSKTKLFVAALGTWLDVICAEINDKAIPRLLRLNGMNLDNPPMLVHGDVEKADLDMLADFLTALAGSGFQMDTSSDGALLRHLLEQADLPAVPAPGDLDLPDPDERAEDLNAPAVPRDPPAQTAVRRPATGPQRPQLAKPSARAQAQAALPQKGPAKRATEPVALKDVNLRDLKVVAWDLDDTALKHPQVFVPLAKLLAKAGVKQGILTGNNTAKDGDARHMWDNLGYPKPDFVEIHPSEDMKQRAVWKAGQCEAHKVDLLIDDFFHGRYSAEFMKVKPDGLIVLQSLVPADAPYQYVGK